MSNSRYQKPDKPLIVIGGGGHASVLVDILISLGCDILAYVAPQEASNQSLFGNLTRYPDDSDVRAHAVQDISLVNGIGMLPGDGLRAKIFNDFIELGYCFASVIAPSAIISEHAVIQQGVQLLPGSVVNVGAKIGSNTIINSGAIIEHDCQIGAHNHIAPGATLSGGVSTQEHCHVGTGAAIIQGIKLGVEAVVGAGAVVNRHVENKQIVYPALTTVKNRRD